MSFRNIFSIKAMKVIGIFLIISSLLSSMLLLFATKVQANYSSEFSKYPGYEQLIKELQNQYPNWEFEIYKTGIQWADAIKGETTARHGRNVTDKAYNTANKDWFCPTCKDKEYEPRWHCASEAAVSYYMDPRNSLSISYVFQFEQLTYDVANQIQSGTEIIIADCNYLQGKISYYDAASKTTKTINKTYAQVIMEAAKEANVSPYHIASRIRQEQGPGNATPLCSGTWTGEGGAYKGYYNYFNMGAYGDTIIKNGLTFAKNRGWTDPEKAIKGGAKLLASDYIAGGQDTLYFEKFDVGPLMGSNDSHFTWQYMTNVSASKSEAISVKNAYANAAILNKTSKFKFKIPVYENMPQERSKLPGTEQIVTENVEINNSDVIVRKAKSTSADIVATLAKGTKILRIELDNQKDSNGRYWDKVIIENGKKMGYISREFLTKLNDITNCKESYIVTDYTNFRNGPGVTSSNGTTILELLSPGQILTVIEKNVYNNVDGEDWYRVKLADGTQGYVGSGYIKRYDDNSSEYDRVKVVCTDGLNIRKSPGKTQTVLTTVTEGTILTRTGKNVSSADGYVWDKVTTSGGIVGYVVREDPTTKKQWIVPCETSPDDEIQGNGFKTDGTNIICQPKITVANIKKSASDAVIKNGSTTIANDGTVGTGYTLTSKGKTYTIIMLGDVNGDGDITTVDAARVLKAAAKKYSLTGAFLKAADVNKDGTITTVDAARVLKAAAGKYSITI